MTDGVSIEGGCLCGALRYRLTAPPTPGSVCHCGDCRRAAGAPLLAWVAARRQDFLLLSGEPRRITHAGRMRTFAPCCGTQILIQDAEDSAMLDVTTCSLDHPDLFPPKGEIWLEDRLPWVRERLIR